MPQEDHFRGCTQRDEISISSQRTYQRISDVLLLSLILEASCAPAPGLVDAYGSGAHRDMDYAKFTRSSVAIAPSFAAMAEAGALHLGMPHGMLAKVRKIGRRAEDAMFRVTSGVNTHKGAIFSLGLMAAAAGYILARRGGLDPPSISDTVKAIACGIVARDLLCLDKSVASLASLSHGERIYLRHGLTGARGEAEQGFPTELGYGLPAFREAITCGVSLNDAMVHSLITIMAHLDDTCVVHRTSMHTLEHVVKTSARIALERGGMMTPKGRREVLDMDERLTSLGISPGGAGDLLAVTLAFYFLPLMVGADGRLC